MRNIFFESTKRTLLENKTRSAATLVGVIVSISMITVILFSASSFHSFLTAMVKEDAGSWSIAVEEISKEMEEEVEEEGITYGTLEGVAYGELGKSANPQKPFLFLADMDEEAQKLSSFKLLEGRMPEADDEIVLPEHLSTNGGINYKVGQSINIDLGIRVDIREGTELKQFDAYNVRDEIFVKNSEKTFKVVGISERLVAEPYMAAGYTAIVKEQFHISDSKVTFFGEKDYTLVKSIVDKYYPKGDNVFYNEALLSINGDMEGSDQRGLILVFTVAFLFLISIGGCMLMYNTFTISAKERLRQYEILASVGATENQLRRLALYEGGFFAIVGIPLGLIMGSIATYGIFFFAGESLAEAITLKVNEAITFYVQEEMVLLALLVSLVMVQISIMFPAYKAGKTTPVKGRSFNYMSRRTQKEISKSNNLTKRLFGLNGMLARKNFKRMKKQYRTTIISLAMSMVLFITASGMTIYAKGAIDAMIGDESGYEISYTGDKKSEVETAYKTLSKADGVTKSTCIYATDFSTQVENALMGYNVFIIDDDTFKEYIQEEGMIDQRYFDSENPVAIGISSISIYNVQSGRMEQREVFKKDARPTILKGTTDGIKKEIVIGNYINNMPKELLSGVGAPTVIFSQSAAQKWVEGLSNRAFTGKVLFQSANAEQSYEAMKILCRKNTLVEDRLENIKAIREEANSMLMSIQSFSYIFITLIAIVAIANIFNTVSASIEMRKIEFATLLALGMKPRDFKTMIYYECLLLGGKVILYGMPLSLIGVFIIFKSIAANMVTGYVVPLESIILSFVCVIVVVGAIMTYIVKKVKDRTPAEVLKKNNF